MTFLVRPDHYVGGIFETSAEAEEYLARFG
jgi:hypothetical protein